MKKGRSMLRIGQLSCLCAGLLVIPGCATQQNPDPFECFNRSSFKVDQTIDRYVLSPVVTAYDRLLPTPVHTGVDNFFSNTFEPAHIANDILQLDIKDALNDLARFMVNSTLGIGGLFDFASKMGMVKHRNDFGITLAKYGFRNSAYLYLPLLGPMTLRDSLSYGVDYFIFNPISYVHNDKIRLGSLALAQVHYRWRLLPAKKVIHDSFDPYVFVRDAYLQKRAAMISEVVYGHHAAADTFVTGLEDSSDLSDTSVIAEDREEAQQQNNRITKPVTQREREQLPAKVQTRPYKQTLQTDIKEKSLKEEKTQKIETRETPEQQAEQAEPKNASDSSTQPEQTDNTQHLQVPQQVQQLETEKSVEPTQPIQPTQDVQQTHHSKDMHPSQPNAQTPHKEDTTPSQPSGQTLHKDDPKHSDPKDRTLNSNHMQPTETKKSQELPSQTKAIERIETGEQPKQSVHDKAQTDASSPKIEQTPKHNQEAEKSASPQIQRDLDTKPQNDSDSDDDVPSPDEDEEDGFESL